MPTKPTEAEGKDGGETGGFGAEDQTEKGDGRVAVSLRSGKHEYEAEDEVGGKYVPWTYSLKGHESTGNKSVKGVETLCCGKDIGWANQWLEFRPRECAYSFSTQIYPPLRRNSQSSWQWILTLISWNIEKAKKFTLSADVTKLTPYCKEEVDLLLERTGVIVGDF